MSAVAGSHIISRLGDPLFALFIGSTSAYIRIKREHKEKHPESPDSLGYLLKLGLERGKKYYHGEFEN